MARTDARTVGVVVNSRANYGRIKSVLAAIQARPDLELQLIVGASALLYRFGEPIREFIERRLTLLTTTFVVLLVGGFVVVRYLV